ncbi:transposase, IS4 family [Leptospira mayottensis 200901122]|uniref:Transposase, IS4 family n=1 Tax=Leptospira mayottensis 200901122 TaxID=1193010 RepID=A0AA87ML70_9LEPT|nr:transposase, IS4 family [Leptospira mayottensis 200901122]
MDKTYANNAIEDKLKKRNIRYRIQNKKNARDPEWTAPLNPFRWIVECTFAWLNAFRAIKTCWEFGFDNYNALFRLAFAIILFRMSWK